MFLLLLFPDTQEKKKLTKVYMHTPSNLFAHKAHCTVEMGGTKKKGTGIVFRFGAVPYLLPDPAPCLCLFTASGTAS